MRKLAIVAAAALMLTGSVGAANAQYWRGGYHGGYYRNGWGGGGAVAAGLIGGAILGGLITAAATPAYGYGYGYGYGYPSYASYGAGYYPPAYYAPRYYYPGAAYYRLVSIRGPLPTRRVITGRVMVRTAVLTARPTSHPVWPTAGSGEGATRLAAQMQ